MSKFKGLTFERLEILRKLATDEGVLAAAGGEKSRQGLYSRQLKQLEEATGLVLMDRSGRRLRLNQKGSAVVQRFEALLSELGSDRPNSPENALRIGGGEIALVEGIMPLLRKNWPNLGRALHFRNLRSLDAISDFRRGDLDVILVTVKSPRLLTNESHRELINCRYIAVQPKQAEDSNSLLLRSVLKSKIALLEGATPIRNYLETKSAEHKIPLAYGAFCSTYNQVLKMVETGGFTGVIPMICADLARKQNLWVKKIIASDLPLFSISIIYREHDLGHIEGLQEFLKALKVLDEDRQN